MSVSVGQPLLFSQQPSSPSFSSPPQSPTHLQHAHPHAHPQPLPPLPPPSMDTTASAAGLARVGQPHDRDDANMQDGETLANEHVAVGNNHASDANTRSDVAVQVAPVDEDVMDTTPDTNQELVPPGSPSAGPTDTSAPTSTPAVPNEAIQNQAGSNDQAPPEPPAHDTTPTPTQTQTENPPPTNIPPPADTSLQPPPPPPPVEPIRSDSDSSDDEDDGLHPWHPIQEDHSSPDEVELKEIEASPEHSALDHEYWESKAFLPLEEPEYTAGETGRIEWLVDAYNGTRDKPNREIVMKSEPVTVGGHQWQIKFYPKGNDSDYLSVYLECLSVKNKDQDKDSKQGVEDSQEGSEKGTNQHNESVISERVPEGMGPSTTPTDCQHTPLPLLGSKAMPKRNSVAAQVSVVMYNPTEPRVNYSRTALHRFCNGSPDWGWTRFHGPYYDIPHRMRGQRQALLRDDKLAFTGYIRIVQDETNCLWEHHSRDNPWDSFAMTGLQSLMLGEDASAPGGNMISAVASWMLLKPFRNLLYSTNAPSPEDEPFARPKPLLGALQKVLYMLRTQVDPGAGAVTLDDVLDALEWYGIHDRLDKLDVVEIWEVLRAKLEQELHDTPQASTFQALCGPKRDYSSGVPTYRVPVVGVGSMQQAVNTAANFIVAGQVLPQLLTIELDRQDFDMKTRSYVKVMNRVTLDDHITVGGTGYTLYGFVVHKQTLQSYVYQPILRPQGPGSKWYSYSDSKDENQVRCLTKRQAVDAHEGTAGTDRVIGNEPVAYIAMYVCDDMAQSAFSPDTSSEPWEVPGWIQAEVEKAKAANAPPPMPPTTLMPPPPIEEPVSDTDKNDAPVESKDAEPPKLYTYQVINSRIFAEHEGSGFFDAYDSRWGADTSGLISTVQLKSNDSCEEIREKLATRLGDIKDPRQVKFWFLNPMEGSIGRPNLLGTGKIEFSSGSYDRYNAEREWSLQLSPSACRRIWVHVIDFDKLPELPKEEEKAIESVGGPEASASLNGTQADTNVAEPGAIGPLTEAPLQSEDTPMSEPDEPAVVQPEPQASEVVALNLLDNTESGDTAMVEVESASVPDPPTVDVVVGLFDDTEMSGTQEDILPPPPPPPPPANYPAEPTQLPPPPPPPERVPSPEPPTDEIYFFLKFFDPEKQTLEARGSHIALKSTRVDDTVVKLLGLPLEDKKKLEIWEEEELGTTRLIKHRRTFTQVDLHNTAVIIVALPQTPDQRSALAARAAFADPQPFLASRAFARNFPWKMNGHFTYNYFSSQYYKGEIKNGHRHGHGYRIYHSGATYEGTFRLGQRHGHGLYTFQNGDTYDGDWVDNQQHGSGTFVEAATGNTYVGGWKNDKKFGEGVTHWRNAQEAERLCRICWEDAADAAFYDCGHVVACLQCAREVQNCPVCRKRVLSAMKLYYVA